MFSLTVPIISIVIGEGASGGALGIGVSDKTYMLENSWYSVISPESCSSILWKSRDFKEEAAESLKVTSADMKSMNLIDDIIKEPTGGAHKNPEYLAKQMKELLIEQIEALKALPKKTLVTSRINKYCNMGVYNTL